MSKNTPRTSPPVPFSDGGRRYHEAPAVLEQDSPDYQDKALARLQRRYRTADLIVGALVALVLVLLAAALYRWFVLP